MYMYTYTQMHTRAHIHPCFSEAIAPFGSHPVSSTSCLLARVSVCVTSPPGSTPSAQTEQFLNDNVSLLEHNESKKVLQSRICP